VPERINKLQPDRTLQLRGFNTFAAATSITNASPTGFTVSGTFRDPADFAVAVLYDADNYFEHPSIKYLPDFNFAGLTLSFDLNYTDRVQSIDSPKFNWIDWATLDCIRSDVNSTPAQVNLWDNATLVGSSFPAATATCNILAGPSGILQYDRVTLWFQNLAFDYTVPPGVSSVEYQFTAAGAGTVHTITIAGIPCSYTEVDAIGADGQPIGNSNADVVTNLILAIGANAYVIASEGSATNAVLLTVQLARAGVSFTVSASDENNAATMFLATAAFVAGQIVSEINGTNWIAANTTHALLASRSGA
jgi:hypothetical protein